MNTVKTYLNNRLEVASKDKRLCGKNYRCAYLLAASQAIQSARKARAQYLKPPVTPLCEYALHYARK